MQELSRARLFSGAIIIEDNDMKKTIPPVYIVIASALYFLIASIVLEQTPGIDSKPGSNLFKYSALDKYGNTTVVYEPKATLNPEKNKRGLFSNP